MCEIKRYRFPDCCNREKWIITKNAAFCEDMDPRATCRLPWCLFIGGVVEVEGVCGECETAFGEIEGEEGVDEGLEVEEVEEALGDGREGGEGVERRRCG
ncbi:hypothetical protein VF21_08898 [Pseudogymnoascus sp. 05NY08]|nr:hypothetical protein VF21_08898 [Pseudogymnoascus sp. 05NY08]